MIQGHKISTSIVIILFTITLVSKAQDVHFSQFNETPQLLNPGATGFFNGYMRGIINYKNQWSVMGNAFNTTAASFDLPLFDTKRKAHLGAGLNFFNDKAGDSKFGLTQVNLCVSGIISLNTENKLSVGISMGGAQHKANLNSLQWGSQYNGKGFDSNINSGETGYPNSFIYGDLGVGVYYEYFKGKATLARNEQKSFNIGLAYFHINRPTQKYFSVTEKLYAKLVATVAGHFDLTDSRISILPSAVYFQQGPSHETILGCVLRYRIKNATKITGFFSESGVAVGLHYRFSDALIPQVYCEMKDFSIGISYDINISSYRSTSHSKGGVELSLKYNLSKGTSLKQKK